MLNRCVRAYLWMFPGVAISWVIGGFESGGWGIFAPVVFAGAAKSLHLNEDVPLWRLPLHRAFSFFGIAVGTGLLMAVLAWVAVVVTDLTGVSGNTYRLCVFLVFAALSFWPMTRLWLGPALPFIVDEREGSTAFLSQLWIGPGMYSGFIWTGVPGQFRKGVPVVASIYLVVAIYLFVPAGAPDSDALPLAAAILMCFMVMPAVIFLWMLQGKRAYRAATAYESWLVRFPAAQKLPAAGLLEAGMEADDPHWIHAAVREGADPMATDERGQTALHRAAAQDAARAIATLVALGADVDSKDGRGRRPLAVAAEKNRLEALARLVSLHGSAAGEAGREALCRAAASRHADAVRLLVEAGAPVNADSDNWRDHPLCCAVSGGRTDIVDRLLSAGARPPADLSAKRSLLKAAVEQRDAELLEKIIGHLTDQFLAEQVPTLIRGTGIQEAERPSGYAEVLAVLEDVQRRLGTINPD